MAVMGRGAGIPPLCQTAMFLFLFPSRKDGRMKADPDPCSPSLASSTSPSILPSRCPSFLPSFLCNPIQSLVIVFLLLFLLSFDCNTESDSSIQSFHLSSCCFSFSSFSIFPLIQVDAVSR